MFEKWLTKIRKIFSARKFHWKAPVELSIAKLFKRNFNDIHEFVVVFSSKQ